MRSIRNQLVVSLATGVVLLSAGIGVGLYAYMEEVLERGLDAALAARADAIAGAVHMEDDGQPHLRLADATAAARHEGPFYYQVWRDDDGRTVARFAPPNGPAAAPLPAPHLPGRRFGDVTLADGSTARVVRLSFTAQPDEDEYDAAARRPAAASRQRLSLVVAHDRRSIDGPLRVLLTGLLFAAVAVLAGLLAIVDRGVRRGLRPLAEVTRLADRIGPATLDVRFPAGDAVPAELRPISTTLNDLLDRLQAAFDRERRYAAALAHELRTPVAELRSLCEVTLRWPDDGPAVRDALADALAIAREMGSAVENVLLLAKCQAGVGRLHPQAVGLAVEVDHALAATATRMADRHLTVRADVDPRCLAWVDPRAMAVVVRNLVQNVAEHATAGGHVRLGTDQAGDRVTLLIGNTSSGLSPSDVPHLTEAFWRKDAARTDRSNAGLGLAIVDAYCRLAALDFEARVAGGDWFEIRLGLPLAPK